MNLYISTPVMMAELVVTNFNSVYLDNYIVLTHDKGNILHEVIFK